MTSQNLDTTTPPSNFIVGPGANAPAPVAPEDPSTAFVDRRTNARKDDTGERRQFGSSHSGLSDAGRELALAIDQYKLEQHRRYITCDEMLKVMMSLGYSRNE